MDPGVKELCSTDFPLREWLCGCESLQDRITDNKQIMWSLHRTETRTTAFTLSSFNVFVLLMWTQKHQNHQYHSVRHDDHQITIKSSKIKSVYSQKTSKQPKLRPSSHSPNQNQQVPIQDQDPSQAQSPESMNRSWKAKPQVQSQVPTSPTLRSLFCFVRPMSRSKSRPTSPKWRAKSVPEFRA